MRTKTIVLTLGLFIAAATLCFASELHMGTWKLNESKSKLEPNGRKNHTVTYAPEGDSVKITVDGVNSKGTAMHDEWVGKFDGKDYPLVGDPDADVRAYTLVDAETLKLVVKKEGKVVANVDIVVASDGKTRTVTVNRIDSTGKKISSTSVYDKQ